MHPPSVASWGGSANGIGGDVSAHHSKVDDAFDDGAPGLAGFETYGALASYTSLFSGVVKNVGGTVKGNGANLTTSSSTVTGHDGRSATEVHGAGNSIGSINTRTPL